MKKKKSDVKLKNFINRFFNLIGYAVILFLTSLIFKQTFQIDTSNYGLWLLLASLIIHILNKTVKPIIFWVTLPITGLTMGIFYPVINIIILKLTDLLLGAHFKISGFLMLFIVSIFISIMNIIMDRAIIKPIIRKGR